MSRKLSSKKTFKEGRMRRLLKTATLGMFASAFMLSGAMAGNLYIVDAAGDGSNLGEDHINTEIKAASEKITSNYKINIDNIGGGGKARDIIYSTSTDLASGSVVYFKLTNAEWEVCKSGSTDKIYLVGKDKDFSDNPGSSGDAILVGSMDACEDPNGNEDPHYVKIVLGTDFPAGKEVYLHQASTAPNDNDDDGHFDNDKDNTKDGGGFIVSPTLINIEVAQGATSGSIQLEGVYAQYAGSSITGGKAPAITLVTFSRQFSWALSNTNGENNSVIDVNPSDTSLARKVFVQSEPETPKVDKSVVKGVTFTDKGSGLDDSITLDKNDKLRVTLVAEYPFTDYVYKDGANYVLAYDLDQDGELDEEEGFTIDSANPKVATIEIAANNINLATDDIFLQVNKTNILNPQKITAKVELILDDENYAENLFEGTVYDWTINGAQFKIPYLYNSSTTFVRIANQSTLDGEITADLIDESGNAISAVALGTVPAKGAKVIKATDIVNAAKAAGWTPDSTGRFTALITVAAPSNQVSAIAIQKIPGGVDRVIPVLTNDNTWRQ